MGLRGVDKHAVAERLELGNGSHDALCSLNVALFEYSGGSGSLATAHLSTFGFDSTVTPTLA